MLPAQYYKIKLYKQTLSSTIWRLPFEIIHMCTIVSTIKTSLKLFHICSFWQSFDKAEMTNFKAFPLVIQYFTNQLETLLIQTCSSRYNFPLKSYRINSNSKFHVFGSKRYLQPQDQTLQTNFNLNKIQTTFSVYFKII